MGRRLTIDGSETPLERWLRTTFPRATWEAPGDALGVLTHHVRLPGSGRGLPPDHLFLDLETLGFVGRPLFLIGLFVPLSGREGKIVQIIARDYSEEEDVLRYFADRYAPTPVWVTFNGKSFDVPCLNLRCAYHLLSRHEPREHLDLLHWARRHFRDVFPDCRLKTLEWRVCGRVRNDDLDGSRVPDAYHRYIRDSDPTYLEPILRHNRDDLLTLAELFLNLADMEES